MSNHRAPELEPEKESTEDTDPLVRALCYLMYYSLAALGFYCIYLKLFV